MLAGGEIGFDRPHVAEHLRILSDIFLRLITVIVAPLILGTLITGIAGHGDSKGVGRIGLKSLVYFEIVTTIAIVIGLAAINISRAGVGVIAPAAAAASRSQFPLLRRCAGTISCSMCFPKISPSPSPKTKSCKSPSSPSCLAWRSAASPKPNAHRFMRFFESLTETMFAFTNIVMYFAPIGVGAAAAYAIGHLGVAVLLPLGKLLLTGYVALIAFLLLVLLPIAKFARLPLKRLLRAIAEPALIAFATSASSAALPRAMEEMEAFGVPRRIVAFVIPAGYSFNLDGSSLYLAIASVFVAQVAGMHMGWAQQLFMVFTLMLTSKGVAGVPRAVLVVLLATAGTFHLPTEPILLILGIDALMDMGRTAVNVIGNCLACAVIARWEGELALPSALPPA